MFEYLLTNYNMVNDDVRLEKDLEGNDSPQSFLFLRVTYLYY